MVDSVRIARATLFLAVLTLTAGGSSQLLRQLYAASPAFSNAVNLSNNSGNSTFPAVAVSGRNVYVAWEDDSPRNPEILFAGSNDNGSSFAPAVNLSNNAGGSYNPEIAAAGGYVYVAWQDNTPGNDEIFLRASSNSGTSFGQTIDVSNTTRDSDLPQMALSGNNIYLVWQEATAKNPDILFRASSNNGASFSPTINLSSNTGFSLTPQISTSQSMVYVTWRDDTNSTGNDETYFSLSSNSGASFSTPRDISNDRATSYQQKIASLANNVYLTWENDSPGRVDVFLKVSANWGASFGPALNVSSTGLGTIPEIAVAGSNVYLAWKDYSHLNPQILFRASNNNGTSFNPMVNLSSDANDDTDQQIASFGSNVYVTWDDTFQTYFISSDNKGQSFSGRINLSSDVGPAVNPGIAAAGNSVYVAWQDNTPGIDEIFFRAGSTASTPIQISVPVSSILTLDNSKVTTTGTLIIDTGSLMVSGSLSVTAADKTTGATTFAKTYVISGLRMQDISGTGTFTLRFLLNVAVLPYALSSDISVQVQGTTASTDVKLSRQLDISGNGSIDIVDVSNVAFAFGTSLGDPKYNPQADFDGNNQVNILDVSTIAFYFGVPAFR